ncbi:dephospho-CoA kinase [Sphingobacterium sp. UT-1RO-CII-1]|uniref:dephospho-CoA kinase n=1 Tax=Sphingobacterium sp. UT-1RO-CII-1 TaxID=2995225 RepID=UPI00227C2FA2|nr:dephospho-CoA kinase [Sphingobacterium sp. UT-1RO-CII-1]MCY4780187.1 dephospho-CoA kinase [Sphingobacterium sp. UT-1RO-CII-1]
MGLKVGITGGIGSGKSYVAKVFKALGVPFYDADKEAKLIMNNSHIIANELIDAFGHQVYTAEGQLDRKFLGEIVFKDTAKLKMLNEIVHPVVIQHGEEWAEKQTFAYSLREAALLFESGSYKQLDYTVLVLAPLELRLQRVMLRDGVSREQVEDRISKQMSDEDKHLLADFVLINDEKTALLSQVLALHEKFMSKSSSIVK